MAEILPVSPEEFHVHYGKAPQRVAGRAEVLAAAFKEHPERFVRGLPHPPAIPTEVWINKPAATRAEIQRAESQ